MPKTLTVSEVIDILACRDFERLIDTIEDHQIEFKSSPYLLGSDSSKFELAKDVSALANAGGGLVLIGFRTTKDSNTAIEWVDSCRPFELGLIDLDQYRKILNEWICPPIRLMDVRFYPSKESSDKGIAVIVVPPGSSVERPYLVSRGVDTDGKVRGNLFGYFERVQDTIPATSAETLRSQLRDGMRFAEVMQRLGTIESFLAILPQSATLAIDEINLAERISDAVKAVEMQSLPNIVLTAVSTTQTNFPDLFRTRAAPIVHLLEYPPVFRRDGFAITPTGLDHPSEIINGHLRRSVARGFKLAEVWQDGALITVGPADDNMLCWFMRNSNTAKPGLPLRSFVLAEVVLNFCRLAIEMFRNAIPSPVSLKFDLILQNMTENGTPCRLSSSPDGGSYGRSFSSATKEANGPRISSSFTASFENIDYGSVAYEMLGRLYVAFGFNHDDMPYIQRDPDANRITTQSLLNLTLP